MQRDRSSAERHWLGMAARGAISSPRFTFNQPRTIPRNLLINKYFSAANLRVCIFIHPLHQGIAGAGARVTQELKNDMGAGGHTSHLPPGFCHPAFVTRLSLPGSGRLASRARGALRPGFEAEGAATPRSHRGSEVHSGSGDLVIQSARAPGWSMPVSRGVRHRTAPGA
jgi:hypothetical protein